MRALFQQQNLVKSKMHLSEQNEDTKGQEDVGGKENYINDRMSHHVLFFPVGLRVTYSEAICCITVTCQAL